MNLNWTDDFIKSFGTTKEAVVNQYLEGARMGYLISGFIAILCIIIFLLLIVCGKKFQIDFELNAVICIFVGFVFLISAIVCIVEYVDYRECLVNDWIAIRHFILLRIQ